MGGLPTPREAAQTHSVRQPGNPCWVCSTPEALAWLEEYMDEVGKGSPRVPLRAISDLFREHLNMPLRSEAPIGNHLRNHTNGKWRTVLRG